MPETEIFAVVWLAIFGGRADLRPIINSGFSFVAASINEDSQSNNLKSIRWRKTAKNESMSRTLLRGRNTWIS